MDHRKYLVLFHVPKTGCKRSYDFDIFNLVIVSREGFFNQKLLMSCLYCGYPFEVPRRKIYAPDIRSNLAPCTVAATILLIIKDKKNESTDSTGGSIVSE